MKSVTVYYVPTCAYSAASLAFLLARGADWHMVNLEQHPELKEALKKRIKGKFETPVLEADGELHVSPQLTELKNLLEQWGLPDMAAPNTQLKHAGAIPAT